MEGQIKGRGTSPRGKPVCTWGWRGTRRIRHRAAEMREAASRLAWWRASYAATRLAAPAPQCCAYRKGNQRRGSAALEMARSMKRASGSEGSVSARSR
ncbi:hypothetical protein XthCFBP4691_16490 [Xanthomonas theicola]|uniref:Uncharacterized protein n=1 Tax=Xanthomonas theicola TaxID=56464 RepID=A0A2S6ZBN2_9XANT|nr:hypothetical protein XthCFBP4691_16490 [Xanthomonas theicola]